MIRGGVRGVVRGGSGGVVRGGVGGVVWGRILGVRWHGPTDEVATVVVTKVSLISRVSTTSSRVHRG